MLTPTLPFKAPTFPNKGLPPLRTLNSPRSGGFGSLLSRVMVGPFLVQGGNTENNLFVSYYADDGILIELQWWPDGRRCLRAVQSLASDRCRLLGERGVSDPPLLSAKKSTITGDHS